MTTDILLGAARLGLSLLVIYGIIALMLWADRRDNQ